MRDTDADDDAGRGASSRRAVRNARRRRCPTAAARDSRAAWKAAACARRNIPPWEGRDGSSTRWRPASSGTKAGASSRRSAATYATSAPATASRSLATTPTPNTTWPARSRSCACRLRWRPAFPAEPLGCAMNIFRRSEIRAGRDGRDRRHRLPRRAADAAGGGRRRARDRDLAAGPIRSMSRRAMGAAETIPMDDHWQIIEQVRELTGGAVLRRGDRGRRQAVAARSGGRADARARAADRRRLSPGRPAAGQHAALELARPGRDQRRTSATRRSTSTACRRRWTPSPAAARPVAALHAPLRRLDAIADGPTGRLRGLMTARHGFRTVLASKALLDPES